MNAKKLKKQSMTEGSLWNKILGFAFPLAMTGILQQAFNAADIAVVGNFTGNLGEACMAAVGANTPIINFIINGFLGISLGTNVVIANAVGSKDDETVQKAVHTSMIVAVIGGVIVALLGELIAEPLFRMQNISEESFGMALLYFRIYIAGTPVILLYNFEAAIFRGIGNTRIPFLALVIAGLINVGLNVFFVVFMGRTVDGVATATVISNMISGIVLLLFLKKSKTPAKFDEKKLRISGSVLKKILKIGIPSSLQACVFSAANIIIQSAINSLGTLVAAASSAAFNIEIFSYYVLNSFGQACTTFTGQNYGARKFDRCKKSLKLCLLEGIVIEGLMVVFLLFFGRNLIAIFKPGNPELVEIGYVRVMFITTAHLLSLFYDVMSGYMRGYGISLSPALVTMCCICGIRIIWIYTVFEQFKSFTSIMAVYPLSLGVNALAIGILLLIKRPAKKYSAKA
ncbi:putative MATE family efflux protein [Ruminococcaceae bacterium R-25]|nr:putative MATE family efflux protein [Ruminococcaceae bacterium R-25]SUQ10716.1 putative efflux protein, MATE family [Oscillospiraceae bacterium]